MHDVDEAIASSNEVGNGFRRARVGSLIIDWSPNLPSEAGAIVTAFADLVRHFRASRCRPRGRGRGGSTWRGEAFGRRVVVRRYLHGGLTATLVPQTFPTPRRLHQEMHIAAYARAHGVPTPAVLGGVAEKVCPGVYRLWIVTEEIPDSEGLPNFLQRLHNVAQQELQARKTQVVRAIGHALQRLHAARIQHGDLSAGNILVQESHAAWTAGAYIVDLDQSRILPEMTARARQANLARLARSLRKLDPSERFWSAADWHMLLQTYLCPDEQNGLAEWVCAVRQRSWVHELWWKVA